MADLSKLATREKPLRASSIPSLYRCELMWLLKHDEDGLGGAAAQTGTATHKAIELWHAGALMADAIAKVEEDSDQWPDADLRAMARMSTAYSIDPRNRVEVIAQEEEISVILPAHPNDPTGEEICIVGHFDQIRDEGHGHLTLWDIKTSKHAGKEILYEAALQQAAYVVGARELGYDVHPGGVIMTRRYCTREKRLPGDHEVFFRYPLKVADCQALLESLPLRVAAMRAGEFSISPGTWCFYWCPARGLDSCREHFCD